MSVDPQTQVTQLLQRWQEGSNEALEALMPLVYKELKRLAGSYLRRERPDHTLQSAALVNEAYFAWSIRARRDGRTKHTFTALQRR